MAPKNPKTKKTNEVQEDDDQIAALLSATLSGSANEATKATLGADSQNSELLDVDSVLESLKDAKKPKKKAKLKTIAVANPPDQTALSLGSAALVKSEPGQNVESKQPISGDAASIVTADDSGSPQNIESPMQASVSVTASKSKKKKQKQKQQHNDDEIPETQPKPKPKSAIAMRIYQEQLRKQQILDEAQRKLDEEMREEEEKQRKTEEDAKFDTEKKAQKAELLRRRRLRLKAEGKLLTGAQKIQRKKDMIFVEQQIAAGIVSTADIQEGAVKYTSKARSKRANFDAKQDDESEQMEYEDDEDEDEEDEEEEEEKQQQEEPEASGEDWELELYRMLKVEATAPSPAEMTDEKEVDQASQESIYKQDRIIETYDEARTDNKKKKTDKENTDMRRMLAESSKVDLDDEEADFRSPICCVLGHVDTGKTLLLDKIRRTNVQGSEAGGITQQIGATFFPKSALKKQCQKVKSDLEIDVPGLLVIDTPGHESFHNLRARGSSLCDIAILVIDIMHGLEPQTKESLNLLRKRKCPFVIALNKIDRMYGWKTHDWMAASETLKLQNAAVEDEFNRRLQETLVQIKEESINADLYWQNDDVRKQVSIVPTSAITGEGIPDLLMVLVLLTQTIMKKAITYEDELKCSVLDVKYIEGLGATIDVILVAGVLNEGDRIVVCGMNGPIVSNIRAILTPEPLKELRVKSDYVQHKSIKASMGIKVAAPGLEDAVAGTELLRCKSNNEDELNDLKDKVMMDFQEIFKSVGEDSDGVYVMASTLGSLEAVLSYLKDCNIPVAAVNIGTVHKLDVKKASIMKERGRLDLAVILSFDVKVDPDAAKEAKNLGVRILTADIMYHLFDAFNAYRKEILEQKRKERITEAVFPCSLAILPESIIRKCDPIIIGVKVLDGILKIGTPLCVEDNYTLIIGKVSSIESNKKAVKEARKGDEVAIKVMGDATYGRQFEAKHKLFSRITRETIDCLKELYRDDLTTDDWKLVVALKKMMHIL